jgi:hypothetical protein
MIVTAGDVYSKAVPRPNNVWFEARSKNTVIVYVHGLLSDSGDAWYAEGKTPAYWPQLVQKDLRFKESGIFLAGYYTAADSSDFSVRAAADAVSRSLQRRDQLGRRVMDARNILFVAHSLGGVVVRYLLTEDWPDFKDKTVGLLLIASPSYGSNNADSLKWLAEMYENEAGQDLQWGSDLLKDLDARFKRLVDLKRIPRLTGMEAYEHHFILHYRYIPFLTKQRVVTAESAGRYFGPATLLPGTNHSSVVKPTTPDHPTHDLLVDFYQQRFEPLIQPAASPAVAQPVAVPIQPPRPCPAPEDSRCSGALETSIAGASIATCGDDIIAYAQPIDVRLGLVGYIRITADGNFFQCLNVSSGQPCVFEFRRNKWAATLGIVGEQSAILRFKRVCEGR